MLLRAVLPGAARMRFDQEYLRRYGHANAAAEVEIVVMHSLATLHMKRPDIAQLAKSPAHVPCEQVPLITQRVVHALPSGRAVTTHWPSPGSK